MGHRHGRSGARAEQRDDDLLEPQHDLRAALREGYANMVNSIYNGFRFEDVWLDK
jgi:hypothetical protein